MSFIHELSWNCRCSNISCWWRRCDTVESSHASKWTMSYCLFCQTALFKRSRMNFHFGTENPNSAQKNGDCFMTSADEDTSHMIESLEPASKWTLSGDCFITCIRHLSCLCWFSSSLFMFSNIFISHFICSFTHLFPNTSGLVLRPLSCCLYLQAETSTSGSSHC